MPNQTAYKQYKEVQVKTANQGKLLIMLYQGCVRFIRLAKKSIEKEDMESANNYIIRSQNIIEELRATLDREKGGELAENLYSLYDYMKRQLIEANVNKEIEPLEVVENLMLELLESWQEIVSGKNKQDEAEKVNIRS